VFITFGGWMRRLLRIKVAGSVHQSPSTESVVESTDKMISTLKELQAQPSKFDSNRH
jgi:hypothetical protein